MMKDTKTILSIMSVLAVLGMIRTAAADLPPASDIRSGTFEIIRIPPAAQGITSSGSAFAAKISTSSGTASGAFPNPHEQYLLELMNRGRADPSAEAARYGVALNEGLEPGTISSDPKQPLALNIYLVDAARQHSQWLLDTDTFSHTGSGGSNPGDRMADAGYAFTGAWGWGENIAWKGTTGSPDVIAYVAELHQGLYVDEGIEGRGHRLNQLHPGYREVGIGIREGIFSLDREYNSVMISEDFAYAGPDGFLTGVAYDDDRIMDDDFYTPGEGLGDITVTAVREADGAEYAVSTWASGGYSLALPSGTYTIAASGDALGGTVTYERVVLAGENVKRDFTPDRITEPEIVLSDPEDGDIAEIYDLLQNTPNPFNAGTEIRYRLPQREDLVSLRIYDIWGQTIRALVHGEHPAGTHSATWDGRDAAGCDAASGVYLCRMRAGEYSAVRKMVLTR